MVNSLRSGLPQLPHQDSRCHQTPGHAHTRIHTLSICQRPTSEKRSDVTWALSYQRQQVKTQKASLNAYAQVHTYLLTFPQSNRSQLNTALVSRGRQVRERQQGTKSKGGHSSKLDLTISLCGRRRLARTCLL